MAVSENIIWGYVEGNNEEAVTVLLIATDFINEGV